MSGEDDLCNWVDIEQNGTESCPPRKENATVSWTVLLIGGWVPEVHPLCYCSGRVSLILHAPG